MRHTSTAITTESPANSNIRNCESAPPTRGWALSATEHLCIRHYRSHPDDSQLVVRAGLMRTYQYTALAPY